MIGVVWMRHPRVETPFMRWLPQYIGRVTEERLRAGSRQTAHDKEPRVIVDYAEERLRRTREIIDRSLRKSGGKRSP